jgi:phosphoribosylanthranilate isomerase
MGHLRIKICGITNIADGLQAAALGADAIGLNFYPASPRHIDAVTAEAIVRELPPFVDAVGLFVNEPLRQAADRLSRLSRIRTIQWHGDQHEPTSIFPFSLLSAFPVQDATDLFGITRYLARCRDADCLPAAVLLDAKVAGQHGGTGQTAPWNLLADFQPGVPVILAGGLTPDNVGLAVRTVRPYAVDVASGVEQGPGRKDWEKMRRFIENAREAATTWSSAT